jgi:hypothetical protein
MKISKLGAIPAGLILAVSNVPASGAMAEGSPTCQGVGGIEVHGQHIVGDYVTGLGAVFPPQELEWPPNGQVGPAMQENHGAVMPGGPGPAFHFIENLAPGASFCHEGHTEPPHSPNAEHPQEP